MALLMLAWASPVAGADDEFNHWYDDTHIPQVCELLGITREVRRFAVALSESPSRYLAIYDLGDQDPAEASAALDRGVSDGSLEMTTAMDVTEHPPEMQWVRPR